jgi:hypothetical protein
MWSAFIAGILHGCHSIAEVARLLESNRDIKLQTAPASTTGKQEMVKIVQMRTAVERVNSRLKELL